MVIMVIMVIIMVIMILIINDRNRRSCFTVCYQTLLARQQMLSVEQREPESHCQKHKWKYNGNMTYGNTQMEVMETHLMEAQITETQVTSLPLTHFKVCKFPPQKCVKLWPRGITA